MSGGTVRRRALTCRWAAWTRSTSSSRACRWAEDRRTSSSSRGRPPGRRRWPTPSRRRRTRTGSGPPSSRRRRSRPRWSDPLTDTGNFADLYLKSEDTVITRLMKPTWDCRKLPRMEAKKENLPQLCEASEAPSKYPPRDLYPSGSLGIGPTWRIREPTNRSIAV